ncbi:hypothetical protein DMC30DRAFT_419235, partial [Rhodotorula diobovata]
QSCAPFSLLLFAPCGGPGDTTPAGEIGPAGYSKLLLLWELVALGEPLLVWASEPRVGAEVVEALRALIKPIPFAGDLRPYFHVHDADFAQLCKPGNKPPQGLVVASTNPLLLSTCRHWPHVLRLDRATPAPAPAPAPPPAPTAAAAAASSPATSAPAFRNPSRSASPALSASSATTTASAAPRPPRRSGSVSLASADDGRGGAAGGGGGAGKEFGLRSAGKRHVRKDEAVEREIEDAWRRGDYLGCDAVIYRHFAALTERFLAPLNRYFGTLWAGNEAVAARAPLVSPGPSPLPSTRFSRSAFLASLRTHGSPLALRSSAPSLSQPGSTATERLYARFLDSDNFAAWADKRVRDTGGEVRRRYVRVLEREDWDEWARGRDEREVEEMVQRLEREVVDSPPLLADSSSDSAPLQKRGAGLSQGEEPGCIFCGVTAASPGFRVVHEDPEFVVFRDRSPGSKVHLLAVPKRHVESVKTLEAEDVGMLERMKHLGRRVLVEQDVPEGEQRLGFHIPPFFSVPHLHLHLLSLPLPFPGSVKYRPAVPPPARGGGRGRIKGWSWFVEVDQAIEILRAGQRIKVGPVSGAVPVAGAPSPRLGARAATGTATGTG